MPMNSMNKSDQSTRWNPTRLPNLWFQKQKPLLQFSLWDFCCVTALTGLASGLTLWSYRIGYCWQFAFVAWSIIAACLAFMLQGRLIRIMLVAAVVCGFVVLAGYWFIGLGEALERGPEVPDRMVLVGSRAYPSVKPDPDDYVEAVSPTFVEAAVAGSILVTIFATPFVIAWWVIKRID
jgi:hypothetical protein